MKSESLALMDFGASGVQSAVSVDGTIFPGLSDQLELSPNSLVTVMHSTASQPGTFDIPAFPALLDRVGEDAPVIVDDLVPEKPHIHLQNIMATMTAGLRKLCGSTLEDLGILVPTYTTEPQRDWIVKAARATGWKRVHLVNKTTALAVHALDGVPEGNYLTAVFGHGPGDISIVRWQEGRVRPLTHVSAANVSGAQIDRLVLASVLGKLMQQKPKVLDPALFSDLDWLWLQRRVESVRRFLGTRDKVTVELPPSLTDGPALRLTFDREIVRHHACSVFGEFASLLKQCCSEAQLTVDQLDGCLFSGGLLWQLGVLDQLRKQCGDLAVKSYPRDAQIFGGYRRVLAVLAAMSESKSQDAPGKMKTLPKLDHHYIASGASSSSSQKSVKPSESSLDALVQRVTDLANAGRNDEANAELQALKARLQALEASLALPEQPQTEQSEATTLQQLVDPATDVDSSQDGVQGADGDGSARTNSTAPETAAAPVETVDTPTAVAKTKDEKSIKRAERRKYIRAKDEINKAQTALSNGQLEQAVGLSHAAYNQSDDHRIFDVMIRIHLIAAAKRPPDDRNFSDERRWLLCALNDDPTREDTQQAIADRYMIHVRQLVEMGTREAQRHAITILQDLSKVIPMPDLATAWIQQLRSATGGKVELPDRVPGPTS